MTEPARSLLYSMGHSNHAAAKFLGLLKQHSIETLVDVRSAPYSRYCPQFNRPALEELVASGGIQYVYMGDRLGGMPRGDAFYDDSGGVRYHLVAQAPFFIEGIRRLAELAAHQRCAMMCSEENPSHCHRHKLVEPALIEAGVDISHIRGDGRLQPADALHSADDDAQLRLF